MQIQKHLFRISEKALKSPNSQCFWKGMVYVLSSLSLYFCLLLVFAHTIVLPNNTDISSCLKSTSLQLANDSLYFVGDDQLSAEESAAIKESNKTVWETKDCLVVLNKNYTSFDDTRLAFGYDFVPLYMDRTKRDKLNYDNYTIILKQVKPMRTLLLGFDVLAINELITNPMGLFIKDEVLAVNSHAAYLTHGEFSVTIWMKVWYLFKVMLSYLAISIVTSLYIYGTIVAAPAVILLILRLCNTIRREGFNDVFKLFPWIGTHAIIRETSNTPIIRGSTGQICKAMLFYFFFLYLVYYSVILWIDRNLYRTHVEIGLQETLFGFIALIEFAAIIFMRTRTFLKYYPPLHSMLILAFLYYGQVCDFGFKRLACYAAFSISAALFSWMILRLEVPAHSTWDPNQANTPREDRPRAGFFPLFNMGWIKNLPEEWTMMMPLFGREHFSVREMALVDRNNQQLALVLGNNH